MRFYTRKLITPEYLNQNHFLFGGHLMNWIDNEVASYCIVQLETSQVATKLISNIEFINPVESGHIIEIGIEPIKFGRTSLVVRALVRNISTLETVATVDKVVFVSIDKLGNPVPHGKTHEEDINARFERKKNLEPVGKPIL